MALSVLAGLRPRVLMVTGAYFPEFSGAGLQCRALAAALGTDTAVSILTTSTDPGLPSEGTVDGLPVQRVFVNPTCTLSLLWASAKFVRYWARCHKDFDIVHLHGFSRKTMLLVWLAWLTRTPIVLKLTSVGHDDPVTAGRWGRFARWCYGRAERLVVVSPRFEELAREAATSIGRMVLIPNGVDLSRFRPGDVAERRSLRAELSLPIELPLVVYIGFFSKEKRPDLLFSAWQSAQARGAPQSALVFIGATRSAYYEVDAAIAERIKDAAARGGLDSRVFFVERSEVIERYLRCADVFVLPSIREGMPNALLEAMASGVACLATNLPGVTDWLLEDGVAGLLCPPDDDAMAEALHRMLSDADLRRKLGAAARRQAASKFAISRTAERVRALYREILEEASAPGAHRANVKAAFDARGASWGAQYSAPDFRGYCLNARRRDVLEMLAVGHCGARVLDAGCGSGDFLGPLLERGHRVTALDLSPAMAECVRRRFQGVPEARLTVIEGDLERTAFPNGAFDGIVCVGVLEYLPFLPNGLSRLHALLAQGGVAVVTIPNVFSPFVWVDRSAYAAVRAAGALLDSIGLFEPLVGRPRTETVFTHRAYAPHRFRREIEANGFHVEDTRYGWFGSFALNDAVPGATRFSRLWERFSQHPALGLLGMCLTVRVRKQ